MGQVDEDEVVIVKRDELELNEIMVELDVCVLLEVEVELELLVIQHHQILTVEVDEMVNVAV